MYAHNAAFTVGEGVTKIAFWILSGVLQGCPLSGMLFAFVIDPFLRCMKATIQDKGLAQIRACADDIGAAMQNIHVLKLFEPIFQTAAEVANLWLKPKKCVVVPTSAVADPILRSRVTAWLETHIPSWKAFNIAATGKYLGFYLGPASLEKQWVAPSAKWRLRAKTIASTHAPASAAALLYNSRAVPVLGYVAQLALLPSDISTAERGVVSAILHAATNTFDDGSIFNLPTAGGPDITSLKVMSLATLARTAYKTLPSWKHCCLILATLTDDMPGALYSSGVASPACWDSPPFAYNLKLVAEGFEPLAQVDKYLKPSHFINKARRELAEAARDVTRNLNHSRLSMGARRVQKAFAVKFKVALLPLTIEALLASRFAKHFAPLCNAGFTPRWEELLSVLRNAQPHFAMAGLKTLLNSWCTRGRYHDGSAENCIFGCADAMDDITHYVCCEKLWRIARDAIRSPLPPSTEEQVLLQAPSQQRLEVLVIAFTVYHALKPGHSSEVASAIRSGDYRQVCCIAAQVAAGTALKFDFGHAVSATRSAATSLPSVTFQSAGNLSRDEVFGTKLPPASPTTSGSGRNHTSSSSGAAAPTTVANAPHVMEPETGVKRLAQGDWCEPECSDLPEGQHHPSCVLHLLGALETTNDDKWRESAHL